MRIATFNVQNMRLRQHRGSLSLDGARDADVPEDIGAAATRLDVIDRRLTAAVMRDTRADVLALQEVFDRATLDHFHDMYLVPSGAAPYPHRACLPGNDGRGLDVAVMSRLPFLGVASHAEATPEGLGLAVPEGVATDLPVFRRDVLRVDLEGISLFICHFKAPYPDAAATWPVRRAEALALRRLIERAFDDPAAASWMIVGDLNEPANGGGDRAIAPLLGPFSVDLMARMPESERWSWYEPHDVKYGRPDAMLASHALARRFANTRPEVIREGMGREAARYGGPHLEAVGQHRPHASDHAAIVVEFAGL